MMTILVQELRSPQPTPQTTAASSSSSSPTWVEMKRPVRYMPTLVHEFPAASAAPDAGHSNQCLASMQHSCCIDQHTIAVTNTFYCTAATIIGSLTFQYGDWNFRDPSRLAHMR